MIDAQSFLVRDAHTQAFVVSVGDYDKLNKTVILEVIMVKFFALFVFLPTTYFFLFWQLSSPDVAYEVCMVGSFEYNYERVTIQAYPDDNDDTSDPSFKVLIQGVVKPYCPVNIHMRRFSLRWLSFIYVKLILHNF